MSEDIAYGADGVTMVGRLSLPPGSEPRPAVLIAHEGNGLDDFQKDRTERFAELGYVAFSLDYHGGGKPLVERAEINERLTQLIENPQRAVAIATAGLNTLLAQPRVDRSRVAAIGYCYGGTLMLELARSGADLKAVIGFHPGLPSGQATHSTRIRGRVLVCVGSEDPLISIQDRLAFETDMRAAGVDWAMNIYGGAKHSFTNPHADLAGLAALEYHEPSERRSWQAMRNVLDEVFDESIGTRH